MLKKKKSNFWQYGKISLPLIIIFIGIGMVLLLQAQFIPGKNDSDTEVVGGGLNTYCKPDVINANTPRFEAYAYTSRCPGNEESCKEIVILDGTQPARFEGGGQPVVHTFVRVKANVPIREDYFTGLDCVAGQCDGCDTRDGEEHFTKDPETSGDIVINGKTYELWYPTSETDGDSAKFGPNGQDTIKFYEYGLVAVAHLTDDPLKRSCYVSRREEFVDIGGTEDGQPNVVKRFWVVDIYKDESRPQLPDSVLNCKDNPAGAVTPPVMTTTGPTQVVPTQNKTPEGKHLQLEYFLFDKAKEQGIFNPFSWWTPACKPAIYLYPETETQVHVEVLPKGFLTYTDPLYPNGGWDATAFPDGKVVVDGKNYPYLYYESKIRDEFIQKPEKGYVVLYSDLPKLYDSLLPKLGLFGNQIKEFKEYWEKSLPFSPYYFVGIMDEKNIDEIEPLQISPKPATIIRVRLYFEALSLWKAVEAPQIATPKRDGFTVVEWGGMVKLDKGTPFTCSQ